MTAITGVHYLREQLKASQVASENLVAQLVEAGFTEEEARRSVDNHRKDSAARMRSENSHILGMKYGEPVGV